MPQIYVAKDVADVQRLHADIIETPIIRQQLSQMAIRLFEEHQKTNPAVSVQISNWHPELVGEKREEILEYPFTLEDAQLTIAREHGFKDWGLVEQLGDQRFNPSFENAVDLLISGEITDLKELINVDESLLTERSVYGHESTLLHYAGSNGVETRRQQVPDNLVEMVNFLIRAGADINAKAKLYGGLQTTLALASTSAHPKEAGIMDELVQLCRIKYI